MYGDDNDRAYDEFKQWEMEENPLLINPCPVCDNEADLVNRVAEPKYVGCKKCNMQGGEHISQKWAINEWNSLVRVKDDENPTKALKDLLHFVYTYEGKRSWVTMNIKPSAMLQVVCYKSVLNPNTLDDPLIKPTYDWVEVSNEKVFTREPDWSVNGQIPPSTAAHIYSILARAKQTLKGIENENN